MNLSSTIYKKQKRPVKIVQFGEGNFLRSFVDRIIDEANEQGIYNGNIIMIKPIPRGSIENFKAQDCLYTALTRGIEKGNKIDETRVITCIEDLIDPYTQFEDYMALACLDTLECVVSNTTEAGIVYEETDNLEDTPALSFPGKLTQFLYKRYKHFDGAKEKGLIFMPCELIDHNGDLLKQCVLNYAKRWQLKDAFVEWIGKSNTFCNTLVDKIVPGYPKGEEESLVERLGYEDKLITVSEPFTFWAIEGPSFVQTVLPIDQLDFQIVFLEDITPYRERKVRILNGAHTSMICPSYLVGNETVEESVKHPIIRKYIEQCVYKEIIPSLTYLLEEKELKQFADDVMERFENPFIRHEILSIALNTTSKWKVRILPSLKDYLKRYETLPEGLVFSFAAHLVFYRHPVEDKYTLQDDAYVLERYNQLRELPTKQFVKEIVQDKKLWDEDLSLITGFEELVYEYVEKIESKGMLETLRAILEG